MLNPQPDYAHWDPMFEPIVGWYSGKAREKLMPVLQVLKEARYEECWPKGVATRSVRAVLGNANEAKKWVDKKASGLRTNGALLEALENVIEASYRGSGERKESGWYLAHAMRFGSFALAPQNLALCERLKTAAEKADRETFEAWGTALRWCKAFAPIAELIELLDSRRQKPTIVFGTLSVKVASNIAHAMGVNLKSLRSPPIEWVWVEYEHKGKKLQVQRGRIKWPEDTVHGGSRWHIYNSQCEACGQRISNPFNWVPLLADAKDVSGEVLPYSLWVGRDCARNLLNVEVSGDAIYERPER